LVHAFRFALNHYRGIRLPREQLRELMSDAAQGHTAELHQLLEHRPV
jgi:hypothetical protein